MTDVRARLEAALTASERPTAQAAAKLAAQHKLYVRDRLALLLDDGSFVEDGRFPWNKDRRASLADVQRLGDVVLLRYALSDRYED